MSVPGMSRKELELLCQTLDATGMVAFEGECWLRGWKKSTHSALPEITLNVATDEEMEPFEIATVKKGKVAGQRYKVLFFEICDDEQIKPADDSTAESIAPHEFRKGGPLSKEAAGLGKREDFQTYVSRHSKGGVCFEATEAGAASFIRTFCDVGSRATIDHSDFAAHQFRMLKENFLIMQPCVLKEAS